MCEAELLMDKLSVVSTSSNYPPVEVNDKTAERIRKGPIAAGHPVPFSFLPPSLHRYQPGSLLLRVPNCRSPIYLRGAGRPPGISEERESNETFAPQNPVFHTRNSPHRRLGQKQTLLCAASAPHGQQASEALPAGS